MPDIALPPASLPATAGRLPQAPVGEGSPAAADAPFAAVLAGQIAAGPAVAATRQPLALFDTTTAGNAESAADWMPDLPALFGVQLLAAPASSGDDRQPAGEAAVTLAVPDATPADAAILIGIPVAIAAPPAAAAPAGDTPAEAVRGGGSGSPQSAILAAVSGAGRREGDNGAANGSDVALFAAAPEQPSLARAEAVAAHPSPLHGEPATAARLEAPLGSRQWDGEFASKLAWMVTRNEQRADLVLNPPQLGRIEVSVALSGDQAVATFGSASPAVREAIEGALPRLRELLLEAGISLGQTHVGAESPQQSPGRNENGDNRGNILPATGSGLGEDVGNGLAATNWVGGGRGLIDVFA